MEIQYINGQRVVIGAPFVNATQRTAQLAEALATATKKTVRATLPNGIRLTVRANGSMLPNGKTRFEQKRFDAFCKEVWAIVDKVLAR